MPGDPKECRQHALTCVRLTKTSPSPQAREQFANLANTWLRLAYDLERAQALLDGLNESQPMADRSRGWECATPSGVGRRVHLR
jgi:hypothetical protein